MYIGIQVSLAHMIREGVTETFDELQDACGFNYLRILSGGGIKVGGPPPVEDVPEPHTGWTGFQIHYDHYNQTSIKPRPMLTEIDAKTKLEAMGHVIEEKNRRGMKMHIRYEMGSFGAGASFLDGMAMDLEGRIQGHPCFNNPNWQGFMRGHVEDVYRYHDVDGFLMMNESSFPLTHLGAHGGMDLEGTTPPKGKKPTEPGCFCEYCCRKAREEGIDVEKARNSLRELRRAVRLGPEGPLFEGWIGYLRFLFEHPEVLQWNDFQIRSAENFSRMVSGALKTFGADKEFAMHVFHPTSFNPLYRLAHNYTRYADFADILTPVVYHYAGGFRYLKGEANLRAQLGGSMDANTFWKTNLALMGYDPEHEANTDELADKGLSHDWLARELARVKRMVAGKSKIVAALGWDVTRNWRENQPPVEDDASVEEAVRVVCRAGIDGMVYARGYPEGTLDHMRAAGRALKEMGVWSGRRESVAF
jgi:hypothetical protein